MEKGVARLGDCPSVSRLGPGPGGWWAAGRQLQLCRRWSPLSREGGWPASSPAPASAVSKLIFPESAGRRLNRIRARKGLQPDFRPGFGDWLCLARPRVQPAQEVLPATFRAPASIISWICTYRGFYSFFSFVVKSA